MSSRFPPTRARRPRHRAGGARPGFTMMELVLASVLGILVIIGAFTLFETMDRAKRLQSARLERNVEFALAHKALQQAFRTLLMESANEPKDDELDKSVKDDLDDSFAHPDERREDAADMRFALQPDASKRASGGAMQSLDLTLTTPPIHGATLSSSADADESTQLRQLAMERRSGSDVYKPVANSDSGFGSKGSGSRSSSDSSSGDAQARADRLRAASAGLTGTAADPGSALSAASQDMEAPRAPGVRGAFEFRSEDDPKILARAAGGGGGGQLWSLWWKQIPYDDSVDPPSTGSAEDRAHRLQLLALARASRTDTPQIKLLSGITDASWQAYRRRRMVPKMAAKFAKELPAYVELKFETVDGRREDWLFEVAWSYGPEPGSEIAANDPLAVPALAGAAGDPNSIAAAVQAALNAAKNGTPGGSTGVKTVGSTPITVNPGNPGVVASAGGSGPKSMTGANGPPSINNSNVTTNPDGSLTVHLPGGGTITIPANAQPGKH